MSPHSQLAVALGQHGPLSPPVAGLSGPSETLLALLHPAKEKGNSLYQHYITNTLKYILCAQLCRPVAHRGCRISSHKTAAAAAALV